MAETMRNIVFYVDDHPDISAMLNFACANIGILVEFIEQPETGLAALKAMRPAAVIVDVFMPRIESSEFVRQTRQQHPDVPIFLISAIPDIEHHAKELGATAYLQKPFSIDQFVAMLDTHIPPELRSARSSFKKQ